MPSTDPSEPSCDVKTRDSEPQPESPRPPKRPQGIIEQVCKYVVLTALVLVAVGSYLYYESQQEPEFYAQALKQPPEESKAKGSQLETRVLDLYNSTLQLGSWRGEFEETALNGWLAMELPKKFPEVLPPAVTAPRVGIQAGQLQVACRVNYRKLRGVVVGKFDVYCTDQKNEIAVDVLSLRLGVIPISIRQFEDELIGGLTRSGIGAQLLQNDGKSTLLLTLPEDKLVWEDIFQIEITSVEVAESKVIVTGTTTQIE